MTSWISLIEASKTVTSVKKRLSSNDGHFGIDVALDSSLSGRFSVVLRANLELIESYSFVLRYAEKGDAHVVLLRLNGDHGDHRNRDGSLVSGPHVHASLEEGVDYRSASLKDAQPLLPNCRDMRQGWDVFRQLTKIQASENVVQAVRKVYASLSQVTFDDLW